MERKGYIKQVLRIKKLVDTFIKEGMLTEEEKEVLLLRVKRYTIAEQEELLNVSESRVNSITRRLKIKYDAFQDTIKELPKRKETTKELYREA